MQSEIITSEPPKPDIKFPVLMRSKVSEAIVLFTGQNEGVCVHCGANSENKIGFESEMFESVDSGWWQRLPPSESVVLRND